MREPSQPTNDDLLLHFQAAMLRLGRRNAVCTCATRPENKIVCTVKLKDTGQVAFVTVEQDRKLVRVLEFV